jgi:hypothetical protein
MSPGLHRIEYVSCRQDDMHRTHHGGQSSDVHGYLPPTSLQSGDSLQSMIQDG